jgi:hypothetical protein
MFYTTGWGKIPLPDSYHRPNGWYWIVGRRETICDSCIVQVVDTAEVMIKGSFNHRKAAPNRYAEHFYAKTWSHGSDNDLNTYCSYSGNMYVVSLKEIIFWTYNRKLFKTIFSYETFHALYCIILKHTLLFNEKCKFLYLFALFDTEGREIKTPQRNECLIPTKTISGLQLSSMCALSFSDFMSRAEFPVRLDLFSNLLSLRWVPENRAPAQCSIIYLHEHVCFFSFHISCSKAHALFHDFWNQSYILVVVYKKRRILFSHRRIEKVTSE